MTPKEVQRLILRLMVKYGRPIAIGTGPYPTALYKSISKDKNEKSICTKNTANILALVESGFIKRLKTKRYHIYELTPKGKKHA